MVDNEKYSSLLKNNKIKTTNSLGKGLSALLGDVNTGAANQAPSQSWQQVLEIELDKCIPSRHQARVEFNLDDLHSLAESIAKKGVLQPILLKQVDDKYEIIAGERRCRASVLVGKKTIPAIILQVNDLDSMEFGLIENLHRKDLTPMEEAKAYQRLLDEFNYTHDMIANLVGKSRSYVTNFLRLLKLPEESLELLNSGKISPGHAKILLGIPDIDGLTKQVVKYDLSVRETEQLAKFFQQKPAKTSKKGQSGYFHPSLALWSTNVNLQNKTLQVDIKCRSENSGEIKIKFKNLQELQKLLNIN
ncbi:Chromosome-partitioning protein Spo0J [Candidatus Hepatincola sp. Pdp]